MNNLNKTNWNLITGLIIIIVNLYWIWDNLYLMYLYYYSGMLFMLMYPDWLLILNAIFGMIGLLIGTKVIRKIMKMSILVSIVNCRGQKDLSLIVRRNSSVS